jgi:hypothetical protein
MAVNVFRPKDYPERSFDFSCRCLYQISLNLSTTIINFEFAYHNDEFGFMVQYSIDEVEYKDFFVKDSA